jgi:hypothetical protein
VNITESRLRDVLACYPWQEYGYKYGRWQRVRSLIEMGFGHYPAIAGVCSPTPDEAGPNWLAISAFADRRA